MDEFVIFPKRLRKRIETAIMAMEEIEQRGYHFSDDARHSRSLMQKILAMEGAPIPKRVFPSEKYDFNPR